MFRWKEAMACLDKEHKNPLASLIAYLPQVAEMVLDKCITVEGDPERLDYCVTYNLEYVDLHPDDEACKARKVWFAVVNIVEFIFLRNVPMQNNRRC